MRLDDTSIGADIGMLRQEPSDAVGVDAERLGGPGSGVGLGERSAGSHVGEGGQRAVQQAAQLARHQRALGAPCTELADDADCAPRQQKGRRSGAFDAWAIQDSNLGPLPYQRSALTD